MSEKKNENEKLSDKRIRRQPMREFATIMHCEVKQKQEPKKKIEPGAFYLIFIGH